MHVNIKKGRDMSVGFISDEAQVANMRQRVQNSIKPYIVFIIFLLCIKTLYSQNKVFQYIDEMMNKTSDSIGQYDLNVFVIGEVELDSLVHVSYEQKYRYESEYWLTYTNDYITKKSNIPYIKNYKENLSTLIYNNDFFEVENNYNVVLHFIYPQCNEYEKERLDSTFAKGESCRMMGANYERENGIAVDHIIDKSREMYYVDIQGKNQYLLVIMNRTWRQNIIHVSSSRESDTTNTYIKFLIPLSKLQKTQ